MESGNVNENRCVLTITAEDFLSFLVVGNGCTASAAEAASGIRAIRLGSLIWLAVTLRSGLRVLYTFYPFLSREFTFLLSKFVNSGGGKTCFISRMMAADSLYWQDDSLYTNVSQFSQPSPRHFRTTALTKLLAHTHSHTHTHTAQTLYWTRKTAKQNWQCP